MQLPEPFITYTRALLGDGEYDRFAAALDGDQPVSIRLNDRKQPDRAAPRNGIGTPVPWCRTGYYLDGRPTFTFDPLFHAGCYYVQEAASMFVEQALKQHVGTAPVVMLDLCAAPGGKSTLARSVLPEGSLLVANEIMRNRAQVLAENLTKWGDAAVVVTNNEAGAFAPLQGFFDVILTDVPCSGEGMFRKDPVAVSEWSEANVELCRTRQRDILTDIWGSLKPGGLLIYSTCTYNTEENEKNVRRIADELGADILPIAVDDEWGITGSLLPGDDMPVYRFLPHKTRGEGLFLAALRKWELSELPSSREEGCPQGGVVGTTYLPYATTPSLRDTPPSRRRGAENTSAKGKPSKASAFTKEHIATVSSWLKHPEAYDILTDTPVLTAFPKAYRQELAALRACLRPLHFGIPLAELKGRDLIPAHALGMSNDLHADAFPRAEVDFEQAIAYLRKEAITLDGDAPRGFVLVSYRGIPLGFVKNIGNRANNLYPQEWRIRSGYLPEEAKSREIV